jgi:hypothetical protein
MHVVIEFEEHLATVKDTRIEEQLRLHADDVTLKLTAIMDLEKLVKEYKAEHAEIQRAAAQFGMFLKAYSMTVYNDATIAYLDYLIKEERGKVEAGGHPRRLDSLMKDRREYEEMINSLTASIQNKQQTDPSFQRLTDKQVQDKVEELYKLKHFGENLRKVNASITAAHEATYRELPFRVRGGSGQGWVRRNRPYSMAKSSMRPQQSMAMRPGPPRKPSMSQPVSLMCMKLEEIDMRADTVQKSSNSSYVGALKGFFVRS